MVNNKRFDYSAKQAHKLSKKNWNEFMSGQASFPEAYPISFVQSWPTSETWKQFWKVTSH